MLGTKEKVMIHETAIIDPTAQIADDVEIGPYSIIGADVIIGSGCVIKSHVVINGPSTFGKNNTIYQFSSLGEAPQDLKFKGERSHLVVGDNNTIREYCTFNRGTSDDKMLTSVGSNNLFMAYCHVAHDCVVGSHSVFANAASIAGHVTVGDMSILGGFTSVHQFTDIGRQAFTGLGSVVTSDIPPFCIAIGNRAKTVSINKEGLKRKGFSTECIRALHKSFRLLIKSTKSRQEALVELEPLINDYAEVKQFVDFVINSKRGIAR